MINLSKLLSEGRYDSLTRQLSGTLLRTIKDSYAAVSDPRGEFAGVKIFFKKDEPRPNINDNHYREIYFEEVENNVIPLEFHLTLKVQWIEGFDDLKKGGDAYNDSYELIPDEDADLPLIEIRFEIDPAEYPNVLSEISMDIRDTLRHEIEHLTQSGWNVIPGKFISSDADLRSKIEKGDLPPSEYFKLPKEIDANIQGLYFSAKKRRVPFKQAVDEYLDLFVRDNVISKQDKQDIINTWRRRLPALGIRQEL